MNIVDSSNSTTAHRLEHV